jgi:hypothetical protein
MVTRQMLTRYLEKFSNTGTESYYSIHLSVSVSIETDTVIFPEKIFVGPELRVAWFIVK